jgi:hypothetical protein
MRKLLSGWRNKWRGFVPFLERKEQKKLEQEELNNFAEAMKELTLSQVRTITNRADRQHCSPFAYSQSFPCAPACDSTIPLPNLALQRPASADQYRSNAPALPPAASDPLPVDQVMTLSASSVSSQYFTRPTLVV